MADPRALTQAEFCARFEAHMIAAAGFDRFDDGTTVAAYAKATAPTYWEDESFRKDGPEASADSDMDYWGED